MKEYKVVVAGRTLGTYKTKEEAEARLEEARKSPLGWCHVRESFWIEEG